MTIEATKHYITKRGRVYYFYRPVPSHISGPSHRFVKTSLQTSDRTVALRKAQALNTAKEQEWASIRKARGVIPHARASQDEAIAFLRSHGLSPGDGHKHIEQGFTGLDLFETLALDPVYGSAWDYAKHAGHDDPQLYPEEREELIEKEIKKLLNPIHKTALDLLLASEPPCFFLSAARDLWLNPRDLADKNPRYSKYYEVSAREFIKHFGDLPLTKITRAQVLQFRDHLLAEGLSTSTVRRYLGCLDRIFSKANLEHQFDIKNPFGKVEISGEGKDAKSKPTFTEEELQTIATLCRSKQSERHLIVALLLNTGARLSEILGLRKADIILDHTAPHIILTDENRSLKTTSSKRKIPLVGISLWAAQEQHQIDPMSDWFFPVYASDDEGLKSNTAAVWIKAFLRKATGRGHTSHSFRHTLADRLKAEKVPKDVREAIAGWKSQAMDTHYGTGYSIEVLSEYMQQLKGY